MTILPLFFVAATLLGFGERPVSDLRLVPMAVYPQVASNGRGFVAAWTGTPNNEGFLFRASIDGAGNVVDSRPIARTSRYDRSHIASDGDRYLVALGYSRKGVLLDERGDVIREVALPQCDALASNGSGYAAVVSHNTIQRLDREGQPVGEPVAAGWIVAIAGSGSGYIVLTHDGRHLWVRTLSRSGTLSPPKDAGYFPTLNGDVGVVFDAAVASNGPESLIVVRLADSVSIVPIHGNVVGPAKLIARDDDDYARYDVLWTGNEFIVSHPGSSGTTLRHVSHDGTAVSQPVTIDPESGSLAWNGWRLLFADSTTARLHAASATFPADGDAHPLALYATAQTGPRIATDGESALVMWMESRELRLSRIAPDGTHADGAGISIDLPDASETGAVAWDGNEWVIAYPSRAGVRLRTMTRAGVLSPETLLPSSGALEVHIASDGGGHFAVVWEELNPLANPDSGLIHVSIDGASPVELTHQINAYPDVTWDGGVFRMVWMNYEWRTGAGYGLVERHTVPVGLTFATINRSGYASITGSMLTDNDQRPRVAGEFTMFVNDGVIVRRGTDDIALNAAVSPSAPPAFAVDDDGHALLVSPGGRATLIGAGEPRSFDAAPDAAAPDVVWTRNGWMLVYTRVVDEAPYFHVPRVFIRTLDTTPARRHTSR